MRHNYRYTLKWGWGWIAYYLRHRRFVAALRQVYWALIRGYDGEACQQCGRVYVLWRASDDLWNWPVALPPRTPLPGLLQPSCHGGGVGWRTDLHCRALLGLDRSGKRAPRKE
jgi:hypothetical protein